MGQAKIKAAHPGKGKVGVAYLHPSSVSVSFSLCLEQLKLYDSATNTRIYNGGNQYAIPCGTDQVPECRNKGVLAFLNDPLQPEWPWFVDSDMGFAPDTVDRLIAAADPIERPIMGGLCWAQRHVGTDPTLQVPIQKVFPTLYNFLTLPDGQQGFRNLEPTDPTGGVMQVGATGAACLLIHRGALDTIYEKYGANWFSRTPYGEDLSFCLRANVCDIPIHVDTSVRTSHHKDTYLCDPGPAGLRPLVAIPVLNHWEDLTLPLVLQLLEFGEADEIVIYDNGSTDDTPEGCKALGLKCVDAKGFGIHEMWNLALLSSRGRPVAILNNDLYAFPGMLTRLAEALQLDRHLAVVCPNYDGRLDTRWTYTTEICASRYDGTGGLAGFAFMVAPDWAATYRFPTELSWWFGDNHLVASAVLAGRHVAVIGDSYVEHLDGGGQTGDWDDPEVTPLLEADAKWFGDWLRERSA